MEPPQKRNAMIQPMPRICPRVEHDYCNQNSQPRRQRHSIQQSEIPRVRPFAGEYPKLHEKQSRQDHIDKTQQIVAPPMAEPSPSIAEPAISRSQRFPNKEEQQQSCAQPNAIPFRARNVIEEKETARKLQTLLQRNE